MSELIGDSPWQLNEAKRNVRPQTSLGSGGLKQMPENKIQGIKIEGSHEKMPEDFKPGKGCLSIMLGVR